MFQIVTHFSEKARKDAAKRSYYATQIGKNAACVLRLNDDGCCPLGDMLVVDGLVSFDAPSGRTPTAHSVAWYLAKDEDPEVRRRLTDEAHDFISKWDNGEIFDLAVALGV